MSNFGSFSDLSSLFTKLSQSLTKRPKTWTGTKADWDQMTAEQKAVYDGWYVNFTDDAEEGGGGAGGGHIIEDSEGTELTQRDTLKVGGSLIAEDDPTNEKTIITDGMEEIDWEDWLEMTDEEKKAVPKALITNVPGLDSKLNVQFLKKLWENPSPTSAFAAQSITLSSDDYDLLLIIHNSVAGGSYGTFSWIGRNDDIISCSYSTSAGTNVYSGFRRLTVNGTSCTYTDNIYTGNGSSNTENLRNVPLAIYGFKASVDVDITAYMADLETDAKNVYLENGESVEDILGKGSVSVTADGTKTYAALFLQLGGLIDFDKISSRSTLVQTFMSGSTQINNIYQIFRYTATQLVLSTCLVNNSNYTTTLFINKSSNGSRWDSTISGSSTTVSDNSNQVPTSGMIFTFYY